MQERVGRPPTCTVQAPHMPMPQPNFVPVRPMTSRMTHSSGVSSSASIVTARPLMRNVIMFNGSERLYLVRGADLPAYRGDLRVEVRPGRQMRAGASQIGGDTSDVSVAEPLREAGHDDARNALLYADPTQHDLDQVRGIGQV